MPESSGSASRAPGWPWSYPADADGLNAPTILVVEDDRGIRDMLSTLLDLAGFEFVTCDSAEAGLAALRERQFDFVLTDYALPSHDGVWLLRQAESEGLTIGTPALIVTAHPRIEDAAPWEVIQKPFDLDELVDRMCQRMDAAGRGTREALSGSPRAADGTDRYCDECLSPSN